MVGEINTSGQVIVATTSKEQAELKRDQILSHGWDPSIPGSKGPMLATIEPALGYPNLGGPNEVILLELESAQDLPGVVPLDTLAGMAAQVWQEKKDLANGVPATALGELIDELRNAPTQPFPEADPEWALRTATKHQGKPIAFPFTRHAFVKLLASKVSPSPIANLPVVCACTLGLIGSPLGQGPLLAVSALIPEPLPLASEKLFQQACQMLLDHHLPNPGMGEILIAAGGFSRSTHIPPRNLEVPFINARKSFLEQVEKRNPTREFCGLGKYALTAVLGSNKGDAKGMDRAKGLCEEVIREYGGVAHPHGGTLASAGVFLQRWLQCPRIGGTAPEIAGPFLSGSEAKLSDFRGKVVVLDFWMDLCSSCQKLFEHAKEMVKRFGKRPFVLVGVNLMSNPDEARKAVNSKQITWPSWYENYGGPLTQQWLMRKNRTVYILDHKGIVRRYFSGFSEELGKTLDEFLEKLVTAAEKSR
jgi:peroxiredoxin